MSKKYSNPLVSNYASHEMSYIFSPQSTYSLWRELWYQLAYEQKHLGLNIPSEALEQMRENINNIDFEYIKDIEKELKHDVMAHLVEFSQKCPDAKAILHLGATSVYVKDNTELIQMKRALKLLKQRIVKVLKSFRIFIEKYKDQAVLSMTHFQYGQMTTVGKRAVLWAQSLVFDLEALQRMLEWMPFRGVKGTVGTGDSFQKLLGSYEKFQLLDKKIRDYFGFKNTLMTGQVYDRKIDSMILQLLNQIAQSGHKFSNDIRLLQGNRELQENFTKKQIGSSAMPYKRNPVLSERMSGLCKWVLSISHSAESVAATQWLERTLDDSSNRRLTIPQSFLAIDAVLVLWEKILSGIKVYPKIIEFHIKQEYPFLITEKLIMQGVKQGGDRQDLHERIRQYAMESVEHSQATGQENDFLKRIQKDKYLYSILGDLEDKMEYQDLIGYSVEQCEDFINSIDKLIN